MGDVALVGAPGAGDPPLNRGAVHVFIRSGGAWSPAGTITPNDGEDGDLFGCAIDFDGQTAVIGACEASGMPPGPGKAYVFIRQGDAWVQQAKLTPDVDGLRLDVDDVALHGDRIVLGSADAAKVVGEWTGAAFVYERQGTEWVLAQTLYAEDGRTDDYFGQSVALSADALLVGAPFKPVLNNAGQGVTYAFNYEEDVERPEMVYLPMVVGPGAAGTGGDLIVYNDIVGGEPDIFTIKPDGTSKTNLTQTPTGESFPRWSPDGQSILYFGRGALYVMPAAGGPPELLIENATYGRWSADGENVVFTGGGIFRADANGENL